MKKFCFLMIAVMSGVMLTACGSASIAPLDYSTDGIVNIKDLPDAPTRPRDVIGDGFLIIPPEGFNKSDLLDGHEISRMSTFWRAGEDSKDPDGYAFFETGVPEMMQDIQENVSYYGILSTTDLGAPLTEAPATAIWPGYFGGGNINRREITYFYVDVESGRFGFYNEADKGIGTKETFSGFAGTVIHTLNGYFGNHPNAAGLNPGQMVGTVDVNYDFEQSLFNEGQATLTGLIGEEGVIGVFRKSGEDRFGGGFTATNPSYTPPAGLPDPCAEGIKGACVDYADWADSFLIPPPTARNTPFVNQFLSGDAIAQIDAVDAGNFSLIKSLNLKDAIFNKTHNPTALDGNDNSGVVYFRDPATSYYYAGLLSGTNLGAPLVEESGNAEWVGRFDYSAQRFTLEIDFANKKVEAFMTHISNRHYHLIGYYNKNGVITGTVDFGFFEAGTRTPTAGEPRYPAILTGLIGENGAVGVFISGTGDKNVIKNGEGNFSYAGGFVAHPYGD